MTLGSITALWAAVLILRERDLKRILAWSTVSGLGTLTLLIGLPNEWSALAFNSFVLAHACCKAPLFFVAGNLDHLAGTRSIDNLRGMGRRCRLPPPRQCSRACRWQACRRASASSPRTSSSPPRSWPTARWLVGATSLLVSAIGVAVAAVATIRCSSAGPTTPCAATPTRRACAWLRRHW